MGGKPTAPFVKMGCVAASTAGAATPTPTVGLVVKASVAVLARLQPSPLMMLDLASAGSSPPLSSIDCSSTVTTHVVVVMDSILTTLSLPLLDPSLPLVRPEMLLLVEGS